MKNNAAKTTTILRQTQEGNVQIALQLYEMFGLSKGMRGFDIAFVIQKK